MSLSRIALALAALLSVTACVRAQTPSGHYRVVKRITIGGEGGWDYLTVDTAAHRLYVSHGTRVDVVDLDHDSVIGAITNTLGVHGIALAPELGRGFTSNGRDSTVTIFDRKTLATIGIVHVGARNPDAILYEPVTRRVFTFNGGSASATAIDAASGNVIGTVTLDGKPEFSASDAGGHVFVNIEDKNEITEFDAKTLAVVKTWALPGCDEPSGLALDRAHRRIFSVCGSKTMVVSDADAGKVVATLPIGDGTDGAAFDPGTGLAFSSNGEGTMTVVHEDAPDRFSVVDSVTTKRGARTVALDPRTHRVFVTTADFGPPPAPTPERPRPRPSVVPGTFSVLVLERR